MESLVWNLKAISSLQQFKTLLNGCCNLVLICKDITPKYGRTRSKRVFSTIGKFSIKRWILYRKFLKHLPLKISG